MIVFANPVAYELWMGRWSARLAPSFVDFADLPAGARCLDVGSGTGALSVALLAGVADCRVVGVEPAADYVAYAEGEIADPRAHFEQGDALALSYADCSFEATVSLLILQELPDAAKAVAEMCRVTRPGGCVAACQWDFVDGFSMLQIFWQTVIEVVDSDEARRQAKDCMPPGYSNAPALEALWRAAGLTDVETKSLEIVMRFEGFDDYWRPFLSGVTQTSSYAETLAEAEREALRQALFAKLLNGGADRAISLPARAWAVRGKRAA